MGMQARIVKRRRRPQAGKGQAHRPAAAEAKATRWECQGRRASPRWRAGSRGGQRLRAGGCAETHGLFRDPVGRRGRGGGCRHVSAAVPDRRASAQSPREEALAPPGTSRRRSGARRDGRASFHDRLPAIPNFRIPRLHGCRRRFCKCLSARRRSPGGRIVFVGRSVRRDRREPRPFVRGTDRRPPCPGMATAGSGPRSAAPCPRRPIPFLPKACPSPGGRRKGLDISHPSCDIARVVRCCVDAAQGQGIEEHRK
jgi:hypothetical protein